MSFVLYRAPHVQLVRLFRGISLTTGIVSTASTPLFFLAENVPLSASIGLSTAVVFTGTLSTLAFHSMLKPFVVNISQDKASDDLQFTTINLWIRNQATLVHKKNLSVVDYGIPLLRDSKSKRLFFVMPDDMQDLAQRGILPKLQEKEISN
jgi:hypothetical protein